MKKLALCFRPVGIDHRRGEDHDDEVVVVAVSKKSIVGSKEDKNRKTTAAAPAVAAGIGSSEFSCRSRRLKKTGSRKPFSRVIKSILFKTSPRIIGEIETDQKVAINVQQQVSPTITSSTVSFSTPVSPESEFAISRSNSLENKPKPAKLISTKEKNSILYVIVLALFVTVMFSKSLAIFFTSLSLYILPMVINADYWRRPGNDAMEMETGIEGGVERKTIEELLWKRFYTISQSIKFMTR